MSKRGDSSKQQILDSAVELFREGGFRALRITGICERAKISPTSVYWHFGNKAGLVQAVLEAAFGPVGKSIFNTEAVEQPSLGAFLKSIEKLVTEQPFGSLTMLAYVADNLDDADLEAALRATRRKELKMQTEIISSVLNLEGDTARELGLLINACVNYAALVKLSGGSQRDVKEVLNALVSFIPTTSE